MASRQRQAKPHKRDGFWYLIRRVPEQFVALDRRRKVSLSTGIRVADDPRAIRARQAVQELDARLQRFWRQKRDGTDASAEQRYHDALRRARELDIPYLPNHELPKLPLQKLRKRFLILTASCPETQLMSGLIDEKTRKELAVVLGGEAVPAMTTSGYPKEH